MWDVHKFGGTSVQDAPCMLSVVDILRAQRRDNVRDVDEDDLNPAGHGGDSSSTPPGGQLPQPANDPPRLCVVVSAMGGTPKTTNLLLELVKRASRNEAYSEVLQQIEQKHLDCLWELFGTTSTNNSRRNKSSPKMEFTHSYRSNNSSSSATTDAGDSNSVGGVSSASRDVNINYHEEWRRYREFVEQDALAKQIKHELKEIETLLHAIQILRMEDKKIQGLIAGYGELWSARILTRLLQMQEEEEEVESFDGGAALKSFSSHSGTAGGAGNSSLITTSTTSAGGCSSSSETSSKSAWLFVDAREVITVDDSDHVMWPESELKLRNMLDRHRIKNHRESRSGNPAATLHPPNIVVTGFIASYDTGGATTLGRDGSDYSASIFARLLQANSVCIWTDVSGVFSADPRRVPDAYVLPDVSYHEATELAYFGAKVIHPKTMRPAQESGIPIFLKNTFRPRDDGTRIFQTSAKTLARPVCGFNVADGISLLNVECAGMIEVPDIFARLFTRLTADSVAIQLISQAATQQSVCFGVKSVDSAQAVKSVQACFAEELRRGDLQSIQVTEPCSVVAAVGDGMRMRRGIAGKFFHALGKSSVNVLAIAQGSSERNISAVVPSEHAARALRAVHSEFLTKMNIGVIVLEASTLTSSTSGGTSSSNNISTTSSTSSSVSMVKKLEAALGPNAQENLLGAAGLQHAESNSMLCEFRVLGALRYLTPPTGGSEPDLEALQREDHNKGLVTWAASSEYAELQQVTLQNSANLTATSAHRDQHQTSKTPVNNNRGSSPGATGNNSQHRNLDPEILKNAFDMNEQLADLADRISMFAHQVIVVDTTIANDFTATLHPQLLRHNFHVVSMNARSLGGAPTLYREILHANTRFLDEGAAKTTSHLRRKLSAAALRKEKLHQLEQSGSLEEQTKVNSYKNLEFQVVQKHNRALDQMQSGSSLEEQTKKVNSYKNLEFQVVQKHNRALDPNAPPPVSTTLYAYGGSLGLTRVPLESTLAHLQNSGDRIVRVEGTCLTPACSFILKEMTRTSGRLEDALLKAVAAGLLTPPSSGGGATKTLTTNNSSCNSSPVSSPYGSCTTTSGDKIVVEHLPSRASRSRLFVEEFMKNCSKGDDENVMSSTTCSPGGGINKALQLGGGAQHAHQNLVTQRSVTSDVAGYGSPNTYAEWRQYNHDQFLKTKDNSCAGGASQQEHEDLVQHALGNEAKAGKGNETAKNGVEKTPVDQVQSGQDGGNTADHNKDVDASTASTLVQQTPLQVAHPTPSTADVSPVNLPEGKNPGRSMKGGQEINTSPHQQQVNALEKVSASTIQLVRTFAAELSGEVAVSRLVTLARRIGATSQEDVICEPFLPAHGTDEQIAAAVLILEEKIQKASASNCSYRYLASLKRSGRAAKCAIRLVAFTNNDVINVEHLQSPVSSFSTTAAANNTAAHGATVHQTRHQPGDQHLPPSSATKMEQRSISESKVGSANVQERGMLDHHAISFYTERLGGDCPVTVSAPLHINVNQSLVANVCSELQRLAVELGSMQRDDPTEE
ncbi:unnamed protein product [Amoebophrya sp. A120]|nr:unnamed protein product [Amoebophrya sp. A120]|eukprot:GSA120T00001409001.1